MGVITDSIRMQYLINQKLDLEYGENEAPRIFLGDKTDKRLLEEES